jgi:SEL1 protein
MYQHYLAKILYHGSLYEHLGGIGSGAEGVGAVPQDFKASHELHLDVARLFWPRDPQLDSDILKHATIAPPVKEAPVGSQYSVKACGYLGRMYMRGEGVSVDYKRARMWFERGALYGEKESLNGLGILWRDGLVDGRSNAQKAAGYFSAAASHELSEAKVNLGRLALEKGNMQKAITLFESAIHTGSPFEAYYHLGVIQRAIATQKNAPPGACPSAVSFLKVAVERGAWGAHDLMAQAEKAWSRQDEHGIRQALLLWAMAGEMGVEAAQNNVAFVLDPDVSILERALPGLAATISGTSSSSSSEASATAKEKESDSESAAAEALAQWTRASAQSNVDALVKVGDYHFFGIGLPPQTAEQTRYEKAAAFYRAAADTHLSALAMWNLGWMYEHGRGVPRDFHLAKRYYDLALETNGEAYLPVVISLAKLYVRSAWHTLNGGTEGLRLWPADEDDLGDGQCFTHCLSNPAVLTMLCTAPGATTNKEQKKLDSTTASKDNDGQPAQDTQYEDDEDDSWYIGKARDLINQRRRRLEQQGEGTVDGIDLVEVIPPAFLTSTSTNHVLVQYVARSPAHARRGGQRCGLWSRRRLRRSTTCRSASG